MNKYKVGIDQDLLREFYMIEESQISSAHLKEVQKVINVVFIKHYSSYASDPDLRSCALLAVLERRAKYDPSYSAYNYTYSIVRNEIGNTIKKYSRELFTDDLSFYDGTYITSPSEVPQEIAKYCPYLTGEKPFTFLRVPKTAVVPLLTFLRVHESAPSAPVPDFISGNPAAIPVLYKLISDLILKDE